MLARFRPHLTYANVMATIAVFVALGGGAYAALRLPANSVGTKQIKNKAVTPKKVAASTITLFKGQKGDKGGPGPQGLQGIQGQQGATGPQGPGASSFAATLPQGATDTTIATAPDGIIVGGSCTNAPQVRVTLKTASGDILQLDGTSNTSSSVFPVDVDVAAGSGPFSFIDPADVGFDGIARDATIGKFDRIDVVGRIGSPCTYRGMITPSG